MIITWCKRFADALIWNWLIAGTDAHAKNYSLLLAGGEVRLAPLYDVASALPYGTHERKLTLAMKMGGDYRVHPYRNPWPVAAKDLDLDADACKAEAIAALGRELPSRTIGLIAERADRCRKLVDAPA